MVLSDALVVLCGFVVVLWPALFCGRAKRFAESGRQTYTCLAPLAYTHTQGTQFLNNEQKPLRFHISPGRNC